MTDLSITAASVKAGSNAVITEGLAGAAVTAGQTVIRSTSTGKFVLADADGAGLKGCDGIALNGAADGQPLKVQQGGDITIGATLTPGTTYYLSPTPGGICPLADVASGDDPVVLGMAKSATVLMLRVIDPDVTI
jgi:hypothetical protein